MKQITISVTSLVLVAAVIVAGGVGFLIGHLVYSATNNDLEDQVNNLENEVAGLEMNLSGQEAEISTMEDTISALEDTVATLDATISEQQDTISSQQQQISSWDVIRSSLQSQLDETTAQLGITSEQLTGLQERLNSITVTHQYTWPYILQTKSLDMPISLLTYIESKERLRPTGWSSYVDMAKDTRDDIYIYQVVSALNEPYLSNTMSELQRLHYVITFIVHMPYIVENVATPYDGIPCYPLETLFERQGDSEDTSILVAAILHRMGYDVALLVLEDMKHMAVGVSVSGDRGSYFEYNGKKYFYLETTSIAWTLGTIPPFFQGSAAQVFPLSE